MSELILEPTTTAQWRRLVQEASSSACRTLDEELESYLVFLLVRCCAQTDMLERVMAIEYLQGLTSTQGETRRERLRDVGDHCLLFTGLFPHVAHRRLVRISYFVGLGQSAYLQLSQVPHQSAARLYNDLSCAFVILMDILHSMRELQSEMRLAPLEAIELLQDTGSECARKTLRRYTNGQPVMVATSTRCQ
jgi:valyl-tRNA synthetase